MVLNSKSIENLNVFISYSRPDQSFVDELAAGLEFAGAAVSIDRHSIREGEEWKARLSGLIASADTVVFVLSPDSAQSSICGWEVAEATALGKRILPVLWRPLQGAKAPSRLVELNFVRFDEGRSFMTGLKALVTALNTNLDWLREHTQLLARAIEWERGGRTENRLMSGTDIAQAKELVANRQLNGPEITPLQLDYIRASEAAESARNEATRRQIEERSNLLQEAEAATAQRAEALSKAETALQVAAQLRRRQDLGASIAIVVMSIVGLWAYGVIAAQRTVAREAAREDIRGQIVSYATSPGGVAMDMATGYETSPYATAVSKQLSKSNESVVDCLVAAHKEVTELSRSLQRPFLSTSLNGFIYLARQPATRKKRAILVSVDDPDLGPNARLNAPQHDVEAMSSALLASGFAASEVQRLRNPDRVQIEEEIERAGRALASESGGAHVAADGYEGAIVKTGISRYAASPPSPSNTLLLFFFSGNGARVEGSDYIVPRVAHDSLDSPDNVARDLIAVPHLTERFEELAAASVVILDTDFPRLFHGHPR